MKFQTSTPSHNESPLVSICIPTYNPDPSHLIGLLESIRQQSYTRIEIVVSDDCSDNYGEIEVLLRKYGSADTLISSSDRIGMASNWNRASQHATGDFLLVTGQDDILAPDAIKVMVEASLESRADVVFGAQGFIDQLGRPIANPSRAVGADRLFRLAHTTRLSPKAMVSLALLYGNVLGDPCSTLVRRKAFKRAGGFDESYEHAVDLALWLRLAETGCSAVRIGTVTAQHRSHSGNATASHVANGATHRDRLRVFSEYSRYIDSTAIWNRAVSRLYIHLFKDFITNHTRPQGKLPRYKGGVSAAIVSIGQEIMEIAGLKNPSPIIEATSNPVRVALKRKEPSVVVWRQDLLPASETFIRNQSNSLAKFSSTLLGARKVDSHISEASDRILFTDSRYDRLALRIFRLTRYSHRLLAELKTLRPDVVHAHFAPDAMLIAPACRRLGIPLIVTLHGVDITALPKQAGIRGARYRRDLRRLFDQAALIIAVSEYIGNMAAVLGAPRTKVLVHHIGISTTTKTMLNRRQDVAFDVVTIGRLVEKKGTEDLLRALHLIACNSGQDLSLIVVGAGPLERELRDLATKLQITVTFAGSLPPRSVRGILDSSSVLVVPSKIASNGDSEGLPTVLLEGALAGVPIVATRHSGIPEFVEHMQSGWLCEEGNIEDIANGIQALIGDRDLSAKLAQGARDILVRDFDLNRQTQLLENLYDSYLPRVLPAIIDGEPLL